MTVSDYNSFPEFNSMETFILLQKTKDGIFSIQSVQGCTLEMAAAIYLHRTTGLKPVVDTPHGRFKLSYNQCVRLCVYHGLEGSSGSVKNIYQKLIDDFIDVWENPLLG